MFHFSSNLRWGFLLISSLFWLAAAQASSTPTSANGEPLFSAINVRGPVTVVLTGQQTQQSEAWSTPVKKGMLQPTLAIANHTLYPCLTK